MTTAGCLCLCMFCAELLCLWLGKTVFNINQIYSKMLSPCNFLQFSCLFASVMIVLIETLFDCCFVRWFSKFLIPTCVRRSLCYISENVIPIFCHKSITVGVLVLLKLCYPIYEKKSKTIRTVWNFVLVLNNNVFEIDFNDLSATSRASARLN